MLLFHKLQIQNSICKFQKLAFWHQHTHIVYIIILYCKTRISLKTLTPSKSMPWEQQWHVQIIHSKFTIDLLHLAPFKILNPWAIWHHNFSFILEVLTRWPMKSYTIRPMEQGLLSRTSLDDYQPFDVTTPPSTSKFDESNGSNVWSENIIASGQ